MDWIAEVRARELRHTNYRSLAFALAGGLRQNQTPLFAAQPATPRVGVIGQSAGSIGGMTGHASRVLQNARKDLKFGSDVVAATKLALEVVAKKVDYMSTPIEVVDVILEVLKPIKSVVDATEYKRNRDVVIAAAINQLWSSKAGTIKKQLFRAALSKAIGMATLPPHVRSILVIYDIMKHMESILFKTAHLKSLDPANIAKSKILDRVIQTKSRSIFMQNDLAELIARLPLDDENGDLVDEKVLTYLVGAMSHIIKRMESADDTEFRSTW